MKQNIPIQTICTVILFCMIGITACDDAGPLADESTNSSSSHSVTSSAPPNTVDPASITFASGVIANTANLDALEGQQDFFHLDASVNNPSLLTSTINISVPYEPPSSTPGQINMLHQAYKYTPRNIQYDGNSQLNYEIDGTSYTGTLNSNEQNLMDHMQTFRNHANTAGPGINPSAASGTASKSRKNNDVNVDEMSESQIKKMLKEYGYKVRKLGNRRFELTRRIGNKNSGRKMYMHSLFDANTKEMTPLGVTKNNKRLTKTVVKNKNGKRKNLTRTQHSLFNEDTKRVYIKMTSNQ